MYLDESTTWVVPAHQDMSWLRLAPAPRPFPLEGRRTQLEFGKSTWLINLFARDTFLVRGSIRFVKGKVAQAPFVYRLVRQMKLSPLRPLSNPLPLGFP